MNLDLRRKTKIVCTLGPATESAQMIERLIRAGMNVARINMSHGDESQHVAMILAVREVAGKLDVPVAILMDLPGPRYRTGEIKDGQVILRKGSQLVLTTRRVRGDRKEVSVNMPELVGDVSAGDAILLDDGAILLVVKDTTDTDVICRVTQGGVLRPRRGIAIPGVKMSAPYVSDVMQRHLRLAASYQVEYIALSYVSRAGDVSQIRALLEEAGAASMIIAKIERRDAVRNFDSILKVSDGIMVARGDLGVDITLEKVPVVQKESISKCNRWGKPVITATQMLESMIKAPSPTRAEVADVANAIWDGTDAVMLSAETAVGSYPVEAVSMVCRIARETEAALPYDLRLTGRGSDLEPYTDDAIAYDACRTAQQLGARSIVAFTESGSTAWRVCKYRPRIPVLALTPNDAVREKLVLGWGVYPYLMPQATSVDDLFTMGSNLARDIGAAKEGDLVVIVGGVPIGVPGTTNLLKVERV
ncbi:MAG: pyruvate kinase [Dehalococcoidia bacterium]|nr:MAG: pyruvate kinase [Dehalococcoidia bacterium]